MMNNQYEQDEISLIDLMQVLNKRKMQIVQVFVIVTAMTVLFAFLPFFERDKEYEAISSISIVYNYRTPEDPEQIGEGYVFYQDRMQSIMIPTIKGYAQSLTLLRNVISDLGLLDDEGEPVRAINLAEDITIENQPDSNLIRISVRYKDEQNAAAIANLIPRKLIQMSNANLELRDYNILIIDEARANEAESSGGKLLTLAIGMVLGLMLGVFAAFAKEYMNRKVGSVRDIAALGLYTELEKKAPVSHEIAENILMLSGLSNARKIVIAAEEDAISKISQLYISMLKDKKYKTKIVSYTDQILTPSGHVMVENRSEEKGQEILSKISADRTTAQYDQDLEISIMSIYDDRYPIIAKQSEKAFLIVEQEKTEKKALETLSNIASKYNLDISVIYLA